MVRSAFVAAALVLAAAMPVGAQTESTRGTEGLPLRLGVALRDGTGLGFASELRQDRPFRVRVPLAWSDPAPVAAARHALVRAAADAGFEPWLSLRYRAPDGTAPTPGAFAAWAASTAATLATVPGLHIDVTNRVNAPAPDPGSDAGQPLAYAALIAGVEAVSTAAPAARVGFSVLNTGVYAADLAFFTAIGAAGGPTFRAAVDFVGVQLYPSTLQPLGMQSGDFGPDHLARQALIDARLDYLPAAGLPRAVALEVTEMGFPTIDETIPYVPGTVFENWALRTEAGQARVLKEMLRGIGTVAEALGVVGATWWETDDAAGCLPHGCFGLVSADGERRTAYAEMSFHQRRTRDPV